MINNALREAVETAVNISTMTIPFDSDFDSAQLNELEGAACVQGKTNSIFVHMCVNKYQTRLAVRNALRNSPEPGIIIFERVCFCF